MYGNVRELFKFIAKYKVKQIKSKSNAKLDKLGKLSKI
jgi:hypothetical protein